MSDAANDAAPVGLRDALAQAFVAQSRDLLAASDAAGVLVWHNERFAAATGRQRGDAWPPADCATLVKLAGAPQMAPEPIELGSGDVPLWVEASAARLGDLVLWTLVDVTRERTLAARSARQGELLDMAQEFGRIGIWERQIPSGDGRWDKHVFGFWGLDPSHGTPNYAQAIQHIHPEDRAQMTYGDSTKRAGRYAQRYRVIHADGKTRWIHSQWEVKNGPHGAPDRAVGIMMDDTPAYESARALSDVNAQLQMAVELGKVIVWKHDLKTDRMHYSDRGFELLGLAPRPEGLPLSEARSFIHPEDIPLVLASVEETLRTNLPTDVEARYRRADGSWRYLLTRRVVERDESGKPIAFVGVALDMTERVEHLRRTAELARRLDAASRAAGVGIWTTTAGADETDWNAQMFEIFDRHAPPRPPTLAGWLAESVHPDDRERIGRQARSYFTAGGAPLELELRALRKDGSVRWIVMRADVDPLGTDHRRVFGVAMDVTEYHRALDALREASQRTMLITRHAGIGTWEANLENGGQRWDAQMFHLRGLEPSERVPTREERMAIVHPDDLAIVLDSLAGTPEADLPAAYEFRVRLPDGSYRWLASRSAAVLDDQGRPVRRVGVNWDVTESKNAETARQQAELVEREMKAKSQFLSRMSHELRTPLNAVLGFTQLLQIEARRSKHADQLAKLEHVRAAGDHLLSLINDVLDLSGLEVGEVRLALRPVDLRDLVCRALPLVQTLAVRHGVTVRVACAGGIANADPTRLRQVLINLLSNAIKYNRRGGRVVVETHETSGEAVLVVSDTGRGLRSEQIASLFEPFNRFGVESEGIEGTGIGLTIVKALVDSMGGRIGVTSEPGAGTTFEITLPAASAAAEAPAPAADTGKPDKAHPSARNGEAPAPRNGTILYIEDNPINVLLVEELVRTVGGIEVVAEPTGAAGVARAASLQPDLVLVDLQLPDFDGYEVLRRLRAGTATRPIPCVALSANAMPDDIRRGLDAGFVDYWTKPIDFKQFIAALRRHFPASVLREESIAAVE